VGAAGCGILVRVRLVALVLVLALGQQTASSATPAAPAPLNAVARRALPDDVPESVVDDAVRAGVWNAARTAVAISVSRPRGSAVLAFIVQASGEWVAVDVSAVERGNLGKLGSARAGYDKVETEPVRWLGRRDGLFQVVLRTRAWKAGRRFTVSEPLLIRPDGTVLWR
jgi:hypothetical protein